VFPEAAKIHKMDKKKAVRGLDSVQNAAYKYSTDHLADREGKPPSVCKSPVKTKQHRPGRQMEVICPGDGDDLAGILHSIPSDSVNG